MSETPPAAPASSSAPEKPAAAKKSKKPAKAAAVANKKKPAGPSVSELLVQAVSASKERSGVSLAALKKALAAAGYDVEKNNSRIKLGLKSLVSKGTLVQTKGTGASGSFKLNKKAGSGDPKVSGVSKTAVKAKASAAASKKPKKVAGAAPKKTVKTSKKPKKPAAASKKPAKSPKKAKAAAKPKKVAKSPAKPKAVKPKAAKAKVTKPKAAAKPKKTAPKKK